LPSHSDLELVIRQTKDGVADDRVIAFLCIDNLKGGGFESDGALQLAQAVCSRMEIMFHRLLIFLIL
jgi:hypothetical protein